MEVARAMLAIAGKFPGDYTDQREQAGIPAGHTAANLGRMPYITTAEGVDVGQSTGTSFSAFIIYIIS